ncbi:hypothetical protein J6590_003440 [Homalodisca vitripennis]|nr:hypothetical protein J6590_003440 [Homalodisca vitripennis]
MDIVSDRPTLVSGLMTVINSSLKDAQACALAVLDCGESSSGTEEIIVKQRSAYISPQLDSGWCLPSYAAKTNYGSGQYQRELGKSNFIPYYLELEG